MKFIKLYNDNFIKNQLFLFPFPEYSLPSFQKTKEQRGKEEEVEEKQFEITKRLRKHTGTNISPGN